MKSLPGSAFSRRYDTNGAIVFTLSTCFAAASVPPLKTGFEKAEIEQNGEPETPHNWKTFVDELRWCERQRPRSQSARGPDLDHSE